MSGVCNARTHTLTRTHTHTHIGTDHIDSTPHKHNHTLTLSRETKIPPIRRATEQLGWDLEHTHTQKFRETHTHTQSHTCTEGSTTGSHLRVSDVERKHLEGRKIRLEKETNYTETHGHE